MKSYKVFFFFSSGKWNKTLFLVHIEMGKFHIHFSLFYKTNKQKIKLNSKILFLPSGLSPPKCYSVCLNAWLYYPNCLISWFCDSKLFLKLIFVLPPCFTAPWKQHAEGCKVRKPWDGRSSAWVKKVYLCLPLISERCSSYIYPWCPEN